MDLLISDGLETLFHIICNAQEMAFESLYFMKYEKQFIKAGNSYDRWYTTGSTDIAFVQWMIAC